MIEHSFQVQYSVGEDADGKHTWFDDTDYSFPFDNEDREGTELARAAATAAVLWLQHQDKDDDWRMPFRVVHRITSDDTI